MAASLVCLLGAVLVVSCPDPEPDNGGTGNQTGTNTPGGQTGTNAPPTIDPDGFAYYSPQGLYRNWSFRYKGESNAYNGIFDIRAVADPEGDVAHNVLAFRWGCSTPNWTTIEFIANLPASFPLGDYDGVYLEVKPEATHDYVIMMRKQGQDGAWVFPGQMVNSGSYTSLGYAFEEANGQWGANGFLDEFIQSNGVTGMQLQICPQYNPGAPADCRVNTQYTDYIKNIGFYKGEDYDYADHIMVIWKLQ